MAVKVKRFPPELDRAQTRLAIINDDGDVVVLRFRGPRETTIVQGHLERKLIHFENSDKKGH